MTVARKRGGIIAAAVLGLLAGAVVAGPNPSEMLDDPVLEQRARELSKELRCVVCQNEAIDASNAPLAADMRRLVRERLVAGDSDDEVLAFLTARYGDFVLFRPPVDNRTLILWASPALLVGAGGIGAMVYLRRRRTEPQAPPPLTADEQAALDRLLDERTPS
ncbi:MAG: cytochrome c-type biogenesis protein [Pseudomonadota bacterium]